MTGKGKINQSSTHKKTVLVSGTAKPLSDKRHLQLLDMRKRVNTGRLQKEVGKESSDQVINALTGTEPL